MSDGEGASANQTLAAWLAALAAPGPGPGGGAAAALMTGMAAALAEMVVAYRIDRGSGEDAAQARELRILAAAVRVAAPSVADGDIAVSEGFAAATRSDSGPGAREAAGVAAARSSVDVGEFAGRLVPVLRELAKADGNILLADVGIAACALAASARAAALSLCADLDWAGAGGSHPELRTDLEALDRAARELDEIAAGVRARLVGPAG